MVSQSGIGNPLPAQGVWLTMDARIEKTPTDARAARKEGVVRYILGISLAVVVVLFAVGYVIVH